MNGVIGNSMKIRIRGNLNTTTEFPLFIYGLNKFFVPINITNFDFSPYKIKLNVFILTKKFILFLVLNEYNFNVFLTFFEHNMNI